MFYRSVKDGTTGENGEKLDGHIRDEEYLTCKKVWKEFGTKNMGDVIITIIIQRKISWCFWKVYWHLYEVLWTWSLSLF